MGLCKKMFLHSLLLVCVLLASRFSSSSLPSADLPLRVSKNFYQLKPEDPSDSMQNESPNES